MCKKEGGNQPYRNSREELPAAATYRATEHDDWETWQRGDAPVDHGTYGGFGAVEARIAVASSTAGR